MANVKPRFSGGGTGLVGGRGVGGGGSRLTRALKGKKSKFGPLTTQQNAGIMEGILKRGGKLPKGLVDSLKKSKALRKGGN